jgi:predicted transcriptional regulator
MAKEPMKTRSVRISDDLWETVNVLADHVFKTSASEVIRGALTDVVIDLHSVETDPPRCPMGHAYSGEGDNSPGEVVTCYQDLEGHLCMYSFMWDGYGVLMKHLRED